jgi:hypothetical protein
MIVDRISCGLSGGSLPTINHANWVDATGIHASFDISHRGTSILLKYIVREPQVRAVNLDYNSPVWEDSCVEFFIALKDDPNYYNFEFNAIGTVLGAYGPDRHSRKSLPVKVLEQIETTPSLGRVIIQNQEGNISWELDIVIPVKAFCHHQVEDMAGMKNRGNFYKCGDGLTNPHFLSWKPVETEKPDFHTPRFFGALDFAN